MRVLLRRCTPLLVLLAIACGGEPTAPATGSLDLAVEGLPAGAAAAVTVVGPEGFSRSVDRTETLAELPAGTYTIAASPVAAEGSTYSPEASFQSVVVNAGQASAAAVRYGVQPGTLSLVVDGLPAGAAAAVTITGPSGFSQSATASTTLTDLVPGTYTVMAAAIATNAGSLEPSPGTQTVAVGSGVTATATVTYGSTAADGYNLSIQSLYITQAIQTPNGSVPLVANREGYLRVFVRAGEAGVPSAPVQVSFFESGTPVQTLTIAPPSAQAPTAPSEGTLGSTWNIAIPASLLRPNLSIVARVDPDNVVDEANEGDNAFPQSGTPLPLDVRTVRQLELVLVPVRLGSGGTVGRVSESNKAQYVSTALKLHPLSGSDVRVRSTYQSNETDLQSDNGNQSWNAVLAEIQALQVAEGGSRLYYGVVQTDYTSGVAGVGYVGWPAAVGWDYLPSGSSVLAHEIGHNWGRNHAPCGGPTGVDGSYPRSDGSIGDYGFDVATGQLKPPTSTDIMGYCSSQWVSEYTYTGVLNYRATQAAIATATTGTTVAGFVAQRCLLVWGRVTDQGVELEPAFEVTTRPRLPARAGAYRVEGRDADGRPLFDLSFDGEEVADLPGSERQFAFAVPVGSDAAARLATLRVAGRGREAMARARAPSAIDARVAAKPRVQAVSGGIELRWDTATSPMVLVRDPRTGEILSFARGGSASLATDAPELELSFSDRVRTSVTRVRVRP